MNTLTKLAVTAALSLAVSAPAFAQTAQDAAIDKYKGFVADTHGNCVRTKWMGAEDPCSPAQPAPAPAPEPAPAAVPMVSLEQRTIYFDFDSAALTAESVAKLDALSQIINSSSAIEDVRIHGFTDQFGNDDYNARLANSRASAVKGYLDGRSRLSSTVGDIRGLGKSSPEAGCDGLKRKERIACMAKERRVEIEFKAQQ